MKPTLDMYTQFLIKKKGEKMLKLLINSHTIIQNQVAYRKLFVGIMHGHA